LLSTPLNVCILRALAGGPKLQAELRRVCGSPAQTTLRAQLKRLTKIGVIEKHRRNRFPGVLEYELTATGRRLLSVGAVIERWLSLSPQAPLELGGNPARAALKALAEGWSTTMVRALAARALSLTELDSVIAGLNYPSLERRLSAMRLVNQVEPQRGDGQGTPYAVTEWLRRGIGPLMCAARWERRYIPHETAPFGRLDIEAAFLLAIPLLRLGEELSGSCGFAVQAAAGGQPSGAVMLEVERGRIASCVTKFNGNSSAWALGSLAGWFSALIDGEIDLLELGGDFQFAATLLRGLHTALFGHSSQSDLT
jgi:DNA-binding HxlR family transcriptional regulator